MAEIGDEVLISAAAASSGAFVAVITPGRRVLSAAGRAVPAMHGAAADRPCFEQFYGIKSPCHNCGLDQAVAKGCPVMTPRSETEASGGQTVYNHIYPLQSEAAPGTWVCADLRAEAPAVKPTT